MDPGGAAGGGCPCPRAGQANQATPASEALATPAAPHQAGANKQDHLQGAGWQHGDALYISRVKDDSMGISKVKDDSMGISSMKDGSMGMSSTAPVGHLSICLRSHEELGLPYIIPVRYHAKKIYRVLDQDLH